jgi:hypothetical protein
MPKLHRGRLDGLHGMSRFTADQLNQWAERLEAQAGDPTSSDDPRWLRRWARRIRALADRKDKAAQRRTSEREQRK